MVSVRSNWYVWYILVYIYRARVWIDRKLATDWGGESSQSLLSLLPSPHRFLPIRTMVMRNHVEDLVDGSNINVIGLQIFCLNILHWKFQSLLTDRVFERLKDGPTLVVVARRDNIMYEANLLDDFPDISRKVWSYVSRADPDSVHRSLQSPSISSWLNWANAPTSCDWFDASIPFNSKREGNTKSEIGIQHT
jgi:hypothetical protein